MYEKTSRLFLIVLFTAGFCGSASAGILFPAPSTWWTYMYQGDKAAPGADFTALDGTWSHNNGSDSWDESAIGTGAPGGASALTEGDVTFLRLQDCGDPRPAWPDPGNRKIMFGHSMTGRVDAPVAANILDNGVTITFRARIPTSGPLDDLASGATRTPYPATGDGYVTHDGGKGNFNIRQSGGGGKHLSFSLALEGDDDEMEGRRGLVMNKLNGTAVTGNVDMQGTEPGTVNILELDPIQWNEFWITIEADTSGTGTHVVNIYLNGSLEPSVFYLTAGNGSDYSDSYISMAVGATPQSGAIDIDFYAYKPGVTTPDGVYKASSPSPANGESAVNMPLFQWKAGGTAVLHNVYFGTSPELTEADLVQARTPLTMYFHVPPLTPGAKYYWRVDEIEADGTTVHTGNVWSFITQALIAYNPTPADGDNNASLAPVLTWSPGLGVVERRVYFGADRDAVAQGAAGASKGVQKETTFTPGTLEPLTVYYWRVDEVAAGGEVRPGEVWSFTTCRPVDDFESYTDDEGGRIFDAWIDGWTNNTGSQVGNFQAPFAERTIIYSGQQSMPMDYNNINAPFYSEAELAFAPVQDWTAGGIDTLVLYVRGRSGNAAEKLYVGVEDSTGRKGFVTYPDAAIFTTGKWAEWKVPLSELNDAGVNLARVKKLYLGVGDRAAPVKGGTGRMYIDDIRLTRP